MDVSALNFDPTSDQSGKKSIAPTLRRRRFGFGGGAVDLDCSNLATSSGITTYRGRAQSVIDVLMACSFPAWMRARILSPPTLQRWHKSATV
jgi:hypothetical protein